MEENGDGRLQKKLAAMWQMVFATRSQTLERTGSSEIGLLLFGLSWSPALDIGVTSAVFLAKGIVSTQR